MTMPGNMQLILKISAAAQTIVIPTGDFMKGYESSYSRPAAEFLHLG